MSDYKNICIASKNSIAIKYLEYCLDNYPKSDIVLLPNSVDDGIDKWQKSFKRYGDKNCSELIELFY